MAEFTREEVVAKIAAGESLEGADLNYADLRGANLERANLGRAKLSGTNLYWAYWLTSADLQGARYSGTTEWPQGFDLAETDAVLVEDDD
jgi:uncharacterized protein YjbI with pentapeptide repeats